MQRSNTPPARGREQDELARKAQRVRELLGDLLGAVPLHVEPSPPVHYRMRAEFRVWHEVTPNAAPLILAIPSTGSSTIRSWLRCCRAGFQEGVVKK
jgi:tRNA/tmRNA/rRNA uracil-C5-methylase (TrmA/RlmC/RlmD family)